MGWYNAAMPMGLNQSTSPPPTAVESFLAFLQTWLVVVPVVGLAIFVVYLFSRYRKSQSGNVPPHESDE